MSIFDDGVARRLVGTKLPESRRSWTPHDVILYHLGVGAGIDDMDGQLRYLHESCLVVLPSFAATVAHATGAAFDAIPGLAIDRAIALHGEQEIRVRSPIPPEANTVTNVR
jgi:hypothetical protein